MADVKEPAAPSRERGQAIILVALMLIVLVAFVGLGTDVTLVYTAKAHLQRAIDAAALAAANKLPDQAEARAAAYEFTRLHGYDFDPSGNPLQITFPTENPPRKLAAVAGTVDVDLAFLRVVGWRQAPVTASAMGESAPLDVYLVLDLSESMVYDTPKPACWPSCCPAECPKCGSSNSWQECQAYYCNRQRNCDPLDVHIKDSAQFFIDQLDSRYDRVGVIRYDRWGWYPGDGTPPQSMALTDNFAAVKARIGSLDAFEPYAVLCTNIGDGLLVANHYMSLPPPPDDVGGRTDSIWAIVLLTDGRANMYRNCPGCPDDCGSCSLQECTPWTGQCANADTWAKKNAWSSWNNHKIVVYTIAYGDIFFDYPQYRQLMIDIADITDNGELDGDTENFWAVPDEAGLRQALAEIAERIYTRLVR
ncbi:MAG: VWA domain-containing protein [Anaerolineae bacterium]|nr:VWA domain-containing protein [Anaerolineae bacterium]